MHWLLSLTACVLGRNCYTLSLAWLALLLWHILSSFGQRTSVWTHLAPLKEKLKEFSCPRSSLFFVSRLFKLTNNKQHWHCTVGMRRALNGIYDNKFLRRILVGPVHTESIDSMVPSASSVFPVVAPSEHFAHLKFDCRFYSPLVREPDREFIWLAVSYFKSLGPSSACITPFAQLLLKELVSKANTMDNFAKDPNTVQQFGHSFKKLNNLDVVIQGNIIFSAYLSFCNTKSNFIAGLLAYYAIKKYKIQIRKIFTPLLWCHKDRQWSSSSYKEKMLLEKVWVSCCLCCPMHQPSRAWTRFDEILRWSPAILYDKYRFLPNMTKDIIWFASYGYEIAKICK